MKRVLNSGYIKLLEKSGLEGAFPSSALMTDIKFKFEIKCPLLLLNSFQSAKLGTFNLFPMADINEAYLPPQYYKLDPSGFNPMSSKDCNELNTKYSNFYKNVLNFYNKLLEKGVCQEQAQLVLPHGLFTAFYWNVSIIELATFIEQNYYKSPELYGYCATFSLYLEENFPICANWLKKNKWINFRRV